MNDETNTADVGERIYPCVQCGTMRTKAEGGTVFTVCDECWDDPADLTAARQRAEEAERRLEEAKVLVERLKCEAQTHAQEARTANSTIYEIYQLITGATGEPGTWNGSKPVREHLAALKGKD